MDVSFQTTDTAVTIPSDNIRRNGIDFELNITAVALTRMGNERRGNGWRSGTGGRRRRREGGSHHEVGSGRESESERSRGMKTQVRLCDT